MVDLASFAAGVDFSFDSNCAVFEDDGNGFFGANDLFTGEVFDFFFDDIAEEVFGHADAFGWAGDLDAFDAFEAAAEWGEVGHLDAEAGAGVDFK